MIGEPLGAAMMLPTHVLVGLALATPVAVAAPELTAPVVAGAVAGSVAPDLDVAARHRRTLHFPTGYAVASVPAVAVAVVAPMPGVVAVAAAVVAAAVHCRTDVYAGNRDRRPWERATDRAVYDHARGDWRTARRWIRYDGSPGDLGVSLLAAVPPAAVLDGPYRAAVAVAVGVAVVYTAFRRRIPDLVDAVVEGVRR